MSIIITSSESFSADWWMRKASSISRSSGSPNRNYYHHYKSHLHFLLCFFSEHKLVCFHFIQHNQHFTCTMTVTLIDPISFSKALKLLYCIYSPSLIQRSWTSHCPSVIWERIFCFLHTDQIFYFSSGVHCWNTSAHRDPDMQWTLNRHLLNKRMMHEWKSKYIYRLSYGKPVEQALNCDLPLQLAILL